MIEGSVGATLGSQALPIEPTAADGFITRVTEIDGAVLVDPFGQCHAIGVILDAAATAEGDRARGARYNSAVRYLDSVIARGMPTVILLVSEDGMVNLLSDVPGRIRRVDRDAMLDELRDAAEVDPVDGERFYKAYRRSGARLQLAIVARCPASSVLGGSVVGQPGRVLEPGCLRLRLRCKRSHLNRRRRRS